MVPVKYIAPGIAVFNFYPVPVIKFPINFYLLISVVFRDGPNSLVAANVLGHLHIIIIGIAAFHGVNTPVKFSIVLIHKNEGVVSPEPWHGFFSGAKGDASFAIGKIFTRRPLIPVIDVEKFGICFNGLVPSLLEIDPVIFWIFHCISQPGHIGCTGHVIFIQGRLSVLARP